MKIVTWIAAILCLICLPLEAYRVFKNKIFRIVAAAAFLYGCITNFTRIESQPDFIYSEVLVLVVLIVLDVLSNLARKRKEKKLEAERLEAARHEAEKLEAERVEAARIEAERVEAERRELEKRKAARKEAERIEAQKREAALMEAKKAGERRLEAARAEAAKANTEEQYWKEFLDRIKQYNFNKMPKNVTKNTLANKINRLKDYTDLLEFAQFYLAEDTDDIYIDTIADHMTNMFDADVPISCLFDYFVHYRKKGRQAVKVRDRNEIRQDSELKRYNGQLSYGKYVRLNDNSIVFVTDVESGFCISGSIINVRDPNPNENYHCKFKETDIAEVYDSKPTDYQTIYEKNLKFRCY